MSELWSSSDPATWLPCLAAYPGRVAELRGSELADLDRWYREDLPSLIAERAEPHITAPELVRIVEWKLRRGKWRPRLLDFAKAHTDEDVQAASTAAFSQALKPEPDTSAALAALTKLKGVGPATASAVLAAAAPDKFPFASDEALAAVVSKPFRYNIKEYLQLEKQLQKKAAALNSKSSGSHQWSVSDVERCLWSHSATGKPSKRKTETAKPRKRTSPPATTASKRRR